MMNQDWEAKAYADTDCKPSEMPAGIQGIVSEASKKRKTRPFNSMITGNCQFK